MKLKSASGKKIKRLIVAAIGLVTIGLIWFFRPVSWQTRDLVSAVPPEAGVVWYEPDNNALPTGLQKSKLQSMYQYLAEWWTSPMEADPSTITQLLLVQDHVSDTLASALVADLGPLKNKWLSWLEDQATTTLPQTQFKGFPIYQLASPTGTMHVLVYANLLIISKHALMVEACLAQLDKGQVSWLGGSALWKKNKSAMYLNTIGMRNIGPILSQTNREPWWSFLASHIQVLSWSVTAQGKPEILVVPQEIWSRKPLEEYPLSDTIVSLIPNEAIAWTAGSVDGTSVLAQYILSFNAAMESERVWLGPSHRLQPTRQQLLLDEHLYFSFVLREWKQSQPTDMLGDWPGTPTIWTTQIAGITVLSNRQSALERWVDAYVVGAMGQQKLQNADAVREITLQTTRLPLLFAEGQNDGLIYLKLYPVTKNVWQIKTQYTTLPARPKPVQGDSRLAWQYELTNGIWASPRVIKDKSGQHINEVAVQEVGGRLHVLDANGQLLWEKQIDGPLQSEVWRMENSFTKQQYYVFSTDREWGVMNTQGEWLSGFPVPLPQSTSIGMQLIDFDQNRQSWYVFIPTTGTDVYAYQWTGDPLPGWSPKSFSAPIVFPVQHFQSAYKDYVLLVDQSRQLHVLDKMGETRFTYVGTENREGSPVSYQADDTAVRILMFDQMGRVEVIDSSGQHFPLLLNEGEQTATYLSFADFTGDDRYDYAVASQEAIWIKAYQEDSFGTAYKVNVQHRVDTLFAVGQNHQGQKALLGALDRERQLFSLWQGDQLLQPDMPLAGETPIQHLQAGRYVTALRNAVYAYDL